jgi:hypothetical protein
VGERAGAAPAIRAGVVGSIAVVAGLVLLVVVTWWHALHTFLGDPTIYLIYARNAAHGDLFSFNPHQFSSGSTSPLWSLVLAIPYALGAGAVGAKIVAGIVTVLGVVTVAWSVSRVTGSWLAAALGTAFFAISVAFWGAMMYESPLNGAAIAASIVAVAGAARAREPSRRELVALGGIWAVLPVTRPDTTLVVAIERLVLVGVGWSGPRRAARLVVTALAAAIPSLLYFGCSLLTLGTPSVSSESRSFALAEYARVWHGIHYSQAALNYLSSVKIPMIVGGVGLMLLMRRPATRVMGLTGLAVCAAYALTVTLVAPVTSDVQRYLLPVDPFVALGIAVVLIEWARQLRRSAAPDARLLRVPAREALVVSAVLVLANLGGKLLAPVDRAVAYSRFGYTLDTIVQHDAAEIVNRTAPPHATVLDYEVQDRYDLRPNLRLLALDGLTDGRVMPYLEHDHLLRFLRRYRPTYWIAGDALDYRPSLRRSALHPIYVALRRSHGHTQMTHDGIRFTVIARRHTPLPPGTSGWWRMIVKLSYM